MSAAGAAPRMVFNGVWPTMLVKRQLPGFEQPTAGLAAHISSRMRARPTPRALPGPELLLSEHPAVRWLKDQIDQTTTAFLRHVGIERRVLDAHRLYKHQPVR